MQRQKEISIEGEKLVSELSKSLAEHCKQNTMENAEINSRFLNTNEKLDKLMPLADLIPLLQEIVDREKEQKAVSKWMVRIGKVLGFLAATITAIGVIIGSATLVIKAILYIK